MKIFEVEADALIRLTIILQKLRKETFEPFLAAADRELKPGLDAEDAAWGQLCDAARGESKAEARYRQTVAQHQQARGRIRSVDPAGDKSQDESNDRGRTKSDDARSEIDKSPNKMTVAFGNLFFPLPNGGTGAIADFRAKLAKNTLTDADQKEARERQAMQDASSAKTKMMSSYKSYSMDRIAKLDESDQKGNKKLKAAAESVINGVDEFRKARNVALKEPSSINAIKSLVSDLINWTETAKSQFATRIEKVPHPAVAAKDSGSPLTDKDDTGFALTLDLVKSSATYRIFQLDGTESSLSEMQVEVGLKSNIVPVLDDDSKVPKDKGTMIRSESASPVMDDNNSHADFKRFNSAPFDRDNAMSEVIESCQSASKTENQNAVTKTERHPDFSAFVEHFWANKADGEVPPKIHSVIPCVFRSKENGGFLASALQGRLFATSDAIYFLERSGRKFLLRWKQIVSIKSEKGFLGSTENSIIVRYQKEGVDHSFVIGRLESRDVTLQFLLKLQEEARASDRSIGPKSDQSSDVPRDEAVKTMELVLSKTIKGVTIKRFYEKIWSEGNRTSEKPFYGPWLEEEGCFDIKVGDWEFANEGSKGFSNRWCSELYQQKRLVLFKFKRTSHLYIGPPVANVSQMQYCRVEGQDKCVLAISATFDGIPYSDTFGVEMRWIARRSGSNEVKVDVGLHVEFKKKTLLKSQIKSGTIAETTPIHKRLYEAAKKACRSVEENVDDVDIVPEILETKLKPGLLVVLTDTLKSLPIDLHVAMGVLLVFIFWTLISLAFRPRARGDVEFLSKRIDELQADLKVVQASLDEVLVLLKERNK